MISLSHLSIYLLCTLIFLFFLHKWRRRPALTSGKRLPPSPPKLPVLGNFHQLGSLPHRSLQSLSRRYGPLMLLHFGSVPVVVASSAEAAREIMKNQDTNFLNRPKLSIQSRLLYNYRDVAFAPYGEYWRQIRSICVLQLLSNKRVQSYRRVREEETSLMVEKVRRLGSSSSSGAAVNLNDVMSSLTQDVISRVAFGRKYGEVRSFEKTMTEFSELLGTSPLWEFIPLLSWTRKFDGIDEKIERIARTFDEFLDSVIEEHAVRQEREKVGDNVEMDFVDILLEFKRENESVSPVEDDTIKAVILDMFAAGADTTVTALEWAMAELLKNPKAMKTLQNEVREAGGMKGEIDEEDLQKTPYLKAVMKETLRLHPPIPLLVPRESTQDTTLLGYHIPSATRVIINAWAIGRDPLLWDNPEQFHPERFLDTSIDFRGLHFELIPFGAGRRGCPGIAFAVAVDELALAKLVHEFDFGLPDGGRLEELDMTESSGLSIHRKNPLLVVVTPHA